MRDDYELVDTFHRTINYIRISVTDRCNLRCLYCMPEEGLPWIPKTQILTYEEIARLLQAAARLGVKRLRITGGEPLVRQDLPRLVALVAAIPGIEDIALSTNGVLLAEHARALKEAGLKRVNISLDTLKPDRFARIARRNWLPQAMAGLKAAEEAGLKPIKINTVVMRGHNDDELLDLAALTVEREWHVRFIEVMPLEGNAQWEPQWHIGADDMLERLRAIGELEPCQGPAGNGPARYFRFPNGQGTIGVISPLSHNYCDLCNRVRLTANGQLRLCLFGDNQMDLRTPLRQGASLEELAEIFRQAMLVKPQRHNLDIGQTSSALIALSQVGG